MLTPEDLQQIRRLQVLLSRKVDSPFAGQYRSAFRGQGMEFEEVRPYVPGDEVRRIDWNVTARTGQPFVKEFREERELTLMLVMDTSASMRFGAGGRDGRTDKRLQIARLAGALAYAALGQGDNVGLVAFSDRVERFLPPRKTRGYAWQVIRAAFGDEADRRGTDLALALEHTTRLLRRRAVVCVLSDFLSPTDFDRPLRVLARRHRVNAFLVHDPLEAALPRIGLVELEDAETGRTRLVDARTLAAARTVDGRIDQLRRAGARVRAVRTDEDPFVALLEHFRRLEHLR